MNAIPGFSAEASLADPEDAIEILGPAPADRRTSIRVIPSSSRRCRRLLKKCLAGDDPRSFACDSWLILC